MAEVEPYQPVLAGCSPLSRELRDAVHTACEQWALENCMPSAANRSMWGVMVCGWPPWDPVQSFKSSTEINSTLGGRALPGSAVRLVKNNRIPDNARTHANRFLKG